MSSYSAALADLRIRGDLCEVNLEDFLEGLVEVFWIFATSGEGEEEDSNWRDLNFTNKREINSTRRCFESSSSLALSGLGHLNGLGLDYFNRDVRPFILVNVCNPI